MEKRYQVFISSTFIDLKEERKAVIESLLNAKHIPAGMEMFSASNDEQFKYIKKIIDVCDYYILIIAARYGSINPDSGISYTEQEYDYAVSKGIPILVFLHNDPCNLCAEKREDDKKENLDAFRDKATEKRMGKMWSTTNELVSSVVISLTEEISENPQLGWTRGSIYDATELLEQLNSLRIDKEKLEKEVKKLNSEIDTQKIKIEDLACGNDKYTIKGKYYNRSYGDGLLSCNAELSWDEIFSALGPHLLSAKSYAGFSKALKAGVNSAYDKSFAIINDDCIQTIKIQLGALGLINSSPRKSTGGGILEFIILTKKGSDYLLGLKTIRKNKDKQLEV